MVNLPPGEGDLVWANFSPQSGREQSGRRPAIVLTTRRYNANSGLMIVCPITSKSKGYPFEVIINTSEIDGVVLVDQVKSLDWKSRSMKFVGKISYEILKEIEDVIYAIITQ